MKQKKAISDAVIERLPLYYRDLLLLQDAGIDIISSEKLGERLGITPEQIRKDLTCFGAFGKKGVGYYVSETQPTNCGNYRATTALESLHCRYRTLGMGFGQL